MIINPYAFGTGGGGGGTEFDTLALSYGPTWYCTHNEASGTVANNEVGDNGFYSSGAGLGAAELFTGGGTAWDTQNSSYCEIPATVMPSVTEQMTLGILLKRGSGGSFEAIIDRDRESGGRFWQWRFSGLSAQWIKIISGVEQFDIATPGAGETMLLHLRVGADGMTHAFLDGVSAGSQDQGVADFGTSNYGLRIGQREAGDNQANFIVARSMVYRSALSDSEIAALATAAGL